MPHRRLPPPSRTPSRRRRRGLLAAVGAAVLVVGAAGCGGDAGDDETPERRAFSLGGEVLKIDAENTSVELVPAEVEDVRVTRWFSGWTAVGGDVEEFWEMEGDTLRIGVRCEGLIDNCGSRHRVEVPRDVAVTVDGDNGKVTATGFATALKLRSDNGSVRVENARGPLELKSDNGKVKAIGVAARRVSAETGNGAVELGFTRVPDQVDVTSDNGSVSVGLPRASYRVDAKAGNGDTDVTVPRDTASKHRITVRSDNGDITVRTAE
ncbi:DUF4097 family beta strand repeat-containing protein [Streptomyces xinghaiensis]|uniref:DUF4097 family beta strand repeat-containing protein n=1 Tax=Streptomyces xinghaiensis TaxID=1038928 RepID=UPI000BAF74B8|nr:DUF4097 family beta strand repeat-containing protein [Streptomyces xinghaiensis]MZE80852.1 DUF4097 family beta strand repeat protein [Streptomyces sp. SID5475]